MAAFSTRGLKTYLEKYPSVAAANVIISVSKAAPAVIVPTTPANFPDGQLVKIAGTGMASIDGRWWRIKIVSTALTLACSDTTGEAAAATTGTVTPYSLTTDFVPFCINSISREVPAGESISVATFCDPEAQVSGAPASAGTLSWGGPINFSDAGFCEMQKALADGHERAVIIQFPNSIGHMAIPVEINSYSESMELNAAATWTGGAVVKTKPTYLISEVGACTC